MVTAGDGQRKYSFLVDGDREYEFAVATVLGNRCPDVIGDQMARARSISRAAPFVRVNDVADWLADTLEDDLIDDFDVTLLAEMDCSPNLDGTGFALSCVQCGNTADTEGTAARIDGDCYQFCCPSCEARFREKYEELRQSAD